MRDRANIEYRAELIRKTIHFCSLSIPVLYIFLSRSTALSILIPLTSAFLIVDIARHYHAPTARLFYKVFGLLLRPHERGVHAEALNNHRTSQGLSIQANSEQHRQSGNAEPELRAVATVDRGSPEQTRPKEQWRAIWLS